MNEHFFSLDLHKKYATIFGISQQRDVVLSLLDGKSYLSRQGKTGIISLDIIEARRTF